MDMDKLNEIEEQAKKATPGPWVAKKFAGDLEVYQGPVKIDGCGMSFKAEICAMPDSDVCDLPKKQIKANADFITHARTYVPELCKALRESMAREAAAIEVVKAAQEVYDSTDRKTTDILDSVYDGLEVALEEYNRLKGSADNA